MAVDASSARSLLGMQGVVTSHNKHAGPVNRHWTVFRDGLNKSAKFAVNGHHELDEQID
jgi:hypothetical protein